MDTGADTVQRIARGIEDAAFDRAGAGQRACGVGGGNRKGEPDGKEAKGGLQFRGLRRGGRLVVSCTGEGLALSDRADSPQA